MPGPRGYRHHAETDIDDRDPVEIREPVQQDSASVIVGASEDEIAGFERIAHFDSVRPSFARLHLDPEFGRERPVVARR